MMMKMFSSMLVLLFGAAAANAAPLVFEDGFDYPAGDPLTDHGYTGSSEPVSDAGSLTYTSDGTLVNAGANKVKLPATDHAGVFHTLSSNIDTDSGTVYLGFLTAADANTDFTQLYAGVSFFEGSSERAYVGKNSTGTDYVVQQSGGGGQRDGGGTADTNVTLLVAEFVFGTGTDGDTANLYVNPVLDGDYSDEVADGTITATWDAQQWDTLRIQARDIYLFDEVRIGSTFADVVPVPEPASLALLGLGGLLMLPRRKRD